VCKPRHYDTANRAIIVCKPRHANTANRAKIRICDTANRAKTRICDTANRAKTRIPGQGVGERLISPLVQGGFEDLFRDFVQ
jgi:hypothetical protein